MTRIDIYVYTFGKHNLESSDREPWIFVGHVRSNAFVTS